MNGNRNCNIIKVVLLPAAGKSTRIGTGLSQECCKTTNSIIIFSSYFFVLVFNWYGEYTTIIYSISNFGMDVART